MPSDTLSRTFAALADPTRRAILKRLATGNANVKELSRPFDMSGPAVCKHLAVLERAGLIRRRREAVAMIGANLVDEFHVFVHPIIVGGGTPFLPQNVRVPLELVREQRLGRIVHMHYRRS